jgi:alpha-ketoglutarate-dependent taurine dioxygenase
MTHNTRIDVRPLSGHTGAEILGVDLREKLDEATVSLIRSTLLQWKVVFFRNQDIGHAEQIAFARRFGDLTYAHPHEDEPLDGFPEVLPIDSRRYDRKYGKRYSYESRWHTDVTAAVNPPAASILRAVSVPPFGGDTTWTNLVAAYQGLSAPLRGLLDSLRAEHRFGLRAAPQDSENAYQKKVRENPLVAVHPVVRVHPETRERGLFVSPGFTSHIVGLTPLESTRILDLLFETIAKPAYTVRFHWEPGSIAFWDNRATAHLGPQDLGHLDVERVLYRVTLVGDIPVGIDGVKSELIAGEVFGTKPPERLRAAYAKGTAAASATSNTLRAS